MWVGRDSCHQHFRRNSFRLLTAAGFNSLEISFAGAGDEECWDCWMRNSCGGMLRTRFLRLGLICRQCRRRAPLSTALSLESQTLILCQALNHQSLHGCWWAPTTEHNGSSRLGGMTVRRFHRIMSDLISDCEIVIVLPDMAVD